MIISAWRSFCRSEVIVMERLRLDGRSRHQAVEEALPVLGSISPSLASALVSAHLQPAWE